MANEEKKEKDKKPTLKVLYVGSDDSYFSQVQQRFAKNYSEKNNFEYVSKDLESPKKVNEFFISVVEEKPDILYLDFSQYQSEMLYLAQLINQESLFKEKSIIALLDYLAPVILRKSVTLMGIKFCHVKSGEIHDIVYDAMYMLDHENAKDPDFCIAKLTDDIKVYQVCRLHSVSEKKLAIEGDFGLTQGDEVEIKSVLFPKIVPSLKFIVKEIESVNLTYNFSNRAHCGFIYVDPIEEPKPQEESTPPEPGQPPKVTDQAMVKDEKSFEDREIKIDNALRRLQTWIGNEYDAGYQDKIKLLVIDKEFTCFHKAPKRLDYLSHDFRCRSFLNDFDRDILVYHPEFIVVQYESEVVQENNIQLNAPGGNPNVKAPPPPPGQAQKKDEKDEEKEEDLCMKNGETALRTIMGTIQKLKNYTPFLVIFNCRISSVALQKEFNYPQIMVYPHPLDFEMVNNMASIFKKKLEKKKEEEQKPRTMLDKGKRKKGDNPKNAILKSTDLTKTSAKLIHRAKLLTASESNVMLESPKPLPLWSVHKIEIDKLEMYVTIVPRNDNKDISEKNTYKGLIHALGENEKKSLRRFVNSIFFRKLEEEKKKDLGQFKELNEKKAQEMEEQTKTTEETEATEEGGEEKNKEAS